MPKRKRVKEVAQAYAPQRALKKTLNLNQDLLDQARQALGVRTETEAVNRALELVVRRERQEAGIREFLRMGPLDAARID